MKKITKLAFIWLPTLFWMAFIFFLSSQQTTGISGTRTQRFFILKFFHLIEYSFLFLLFYRSLKLAKSKKPLIIAILFSLLFAVSDELHQAFVPGREGRPRDIFIDLFGILLGLIPLKSIKNLPKFSTLLTSLRGPR